MPNTTAVRTAQVGAAPFFAGKNKIINGDFRINQRNFSSTSTTGTYGFDRWWLTAGTGTYTYSAQTFTPGTAPVAGYEGINFARIVTSGQTASSGYAGLSQSIEDVRTFAGQTVTFSFWAKASTGTPKVQPTIEQVFGISGSATVVTAGTAVTISTSWARYSTTISLPSISGKTIGANNYVGAQLYTSLGTDYPTYGNIGVQAATIDIWGVQLEPGSTATAFQTATGTLAGELAACQRYYVVFENGGGIGVFNSTTQMERMGLNLPVVMRAAPTVSLSGSILWYDGNNTGTATSLSSTYATKQYINYGAVAATGTSAAYRVAINYINAATGNIIASAEL